MLKKCFVSFLIIALMNYLLGCSITSTDKSNLDSTITENIIAIVLKSGKIYSFKTNGAIFFNNEECLIGYENNKLITVPLDQIESFRTKLFPLKTLDEVRKNKIAEILIENDSFVRFNEKGAIYNGNSLTYEGTTEHGKFVVIKSNEIKNVYSAQGETVTKADVIKDSRIRVKQIILKNGIVKTFEKDGGSYKSKRYEVGGIDDNANAVFVNPDDVLYVIVEKADVGTSILATLGVIVLCIGAVGLIIAATKQSCPFIYSFDGNKYIFDAEPLGAATTKGLERYEVSRLEHIKEVNGKYKLIVRNEVEEIQYINSMKLLVVDHPFNSQIVYNFEGKPFIVKDLIPVKSAIDENRNSIHNFLLEEDDLTWITDLPTDSSKIKPGTRNQLTFTFPKTKNADKINLVYNIGTTLWGSRMIREMLNLYGKNINSWYDAIDKQRTDYNNLMEFTKREETYQLKVWIKDKSSWKYAGIINGGGPLISERRVSTFEIPQNEDDVVTIKVEPPKGFWTFNYIAINYSELKVPKVQELNPILVEDMKGNDVSKYILDNDDKYYEMPEIGDFFRIEYQAPPLNDNLTRSIFLGTKGYYKLKFSDQSNPQFTKLFEISTSPGKIVDFAIEKYIEWRKLNNYKMVGN